MKLIDDIIKDLTDGTTILTDVLIKTKVLAFKLKNAELTEWINNELNGYTDNELPDYRIVGCQVIGTMSNGFQRAKNYPIPLLGLEESYANGLRTIRLSQSISTLDQTASAERGTKMGLTIPIELYSELSQNLDNGFHIELARQEIDSTQVRQILTSIRSKLLDFLLNLNEELNDENVSEQDISEVKDIVSSLFQNSVFGNNATIIVGDSNKQKVKNITKGDFSQLSETLSKNGLSDEDILNLKSILDDDNFNSESKKFGEKVQHWISKMMQKAMDGSWNIGLGAAGNLLAEGIQSYYGWK